MSDEFCKIIKNRKCTDCFFFLLFIIYMISMLALSGISIWSGNLMAIINPTDYNGDLCGYPVGSSWLNKNKNDRSNLPYLYYPINYQTFDIQHTGVCVDKCPVGFDLPLAEVFNNLPTLLTQEPSNIICDYPYQNDTTMVKINLLESSKCVVAPLKTESILNRCIINPSSLTKFVPESDITKIQIFETPTEFVNAFKSGWKPILIGIGISLVLCFTWALIVRILLPALVWLSILLLSIILAVSSGGLLYLGGTKFAVTTAGSVARNWAIGYLSAGGCLSVLTFLYLCLVIWLSKRLKVAIRIIQEASKVIIRIPSMLLAPFVSFISIVVISLCAMGVSILIQTSGSTLSHFIQSYQTRLIVIEIVQVAYIFGYLWALSFVASLSYTSVSGVVSYWYFSDLGSRKRSEPFAIFKSIARVIRYHLGSMALGSMLIAILQTLRLMYRKVKNKRLAKVGYCLCLIIEKIFKYINKYAYIMIAMKGVGFTKGSQLAFNLILNNIIRVGAVNTIGTFVLFLGKLAISLVSTVIVGLVIWLSDYYKWYILIDQTFKLDFIFIPCFTTLFVSFVMATLFMDVYNTSIDTITLCFCEDAYANDGVERPYYMNQKLFK